MYDKLQRLIEENEKLSRNLSNKEKQVVEAKRKIVSLQKEIDKYRKFEGMYNSIANSTTWRMTRPVRLVLDKTKELLAKNDTTWLMYKGLRYLKNHGVKKTVNKINLKLRTKSTTSYNIEEACIAKNKYNSVYQDNINFDGFVTDIKVIAFHLPQFHAFKENNEWWGNGFTEWTNTMKAKPLYEGHYQPREPHKDIGYYDLSNKEAIKKQVELANQHGIYGFCYYYYWFSGKRLMEKPLDLLIANKDIKTNFCLCWANESWTRTWDGQEKDILIEQKYLDEDPYNFINDIKKYVNDERYIRINNKPVIVVYNPASIPNVRRVLSLWKETSIKIGIGEISIWICKSFGTSIKALNLDDLVDKEIEFPPHNMGYPEITKNVPNTTGNIFNYSSLVDLILEWRKVQEENEKLIRTVMLCWDNTPRRMTGYSSFTDFDLKKYYQWLKFNVDEVKTQKTLKEKFIFINAWNEWAEGTYLEPDKKYGYANLNTTSEAIFGLDLLHGLQRIRDNKIKSEIVVQIHMFYEDMADDFIKYVNNIDRDFDCYITTNDVEKASKIFEKFNKECKANKLVISVMENKGRDVAPFLVQMHEIALSYKYLCHIHTKRSLHSDFGNLWREYLLKFLLGDSKIIGNHLELFDTDNSVGILYPKHFANVEDFIEWGSNKHIAEELFEKLKVYFDGREEIDFPSGNMFWLRVDAAKQIFKYKFVWDDFPCEKGQTDGTIMHAIERAWNIIVEENGYEVKVIK